MKKRTIFYKLKRRLSKIPLKGKGAHEIKYTYNRDAAKTYAQTHAETPNTKQYPFYKDNDCTNFICQALVAGGMRMVGSDYEKKSAWFCYTREPATLRKCSLTWRSAEYFRLYWGYNENIGMGMAKEYMEFKVEDAIDRFDELYEYLMVGDVVQYADANKRPYHTQIIISKEFNVTTDKHDIFAAQHSANRKHVSLNEYWKLLRNGKGRYIYTYHF